MTSSNDFVPDVDVPDDEPVMVLCFETRELIPEDEALTVSVDAYELRRGSERTYIDATHQNVYGAVTLYFHEDESGVCDWCSDRFPSSWLDSLNDWESDTICRSCISEDSRACGSCGSRGHYDDMNYSDRHDEYYCNDSECYREHTRTHLIQSYHHTVNNLTFRSWSVNGVVRHRVQRNHPYIGLEVETNIRDEDNLNDAAEFFMEGIEDEYLVLKEDGSINGFEIVTHPADYRVHMEMFPFEKLRRLSEYGMNAWTNRDTGIHVHISKNSFSTGSHLYKFMTFHDRNQEAIRRFAGRTSNYAKFGRMPGDNRIAMAKGQMSNYDRYVAVNIQPSATVELRYFRSSLRPATVKGIIQYSHALWQYTKNITANDAVSKRALDWPEFTAWSESQTDKYPDLVPLMRTRGVA